MAKRSWVALAVPLFLGLAGAARSEEVVSETPRITGVEARPEADRTLILIRTTSSSVNYIAYSKSPSQLVVKVYGLEAGTIPAEIPVGTTEVRSIRFEYTPAGHGLTSEAQFVIERNAPGPTPVRSEGETLVVEARTASAAPTPSRDQSVPSIASRPARRIHEILSEAQDQDLTVTIRGDGKLGFDSFTLADPPRLVVDIRGVENHIPRGQFPLRHAAVERIRVAQFQMEPDKVARVVFDLVSPQEYRLRAVGSELKIGFGPAAVAALASLEDASAVVADGASRRTNLAEAASGARPLAPAGSVSMHELDADAQLHGGVEEEEGTLISLDLKDADIKDVLRYFSEISGLNIILDPSVQGPVTVRLIEVPWNKALDIILRSHGFGKTLDGNVLRIAEVSKLTREEIEAAELKKQQEENKPLVTITRPISYGSAQDIANVIQQTALSKKGSIIIDQRTNTLVITEVDIPDYFQRILQLIQTLDTATPQVEIEARIVETSRIYARSIGIQWGFSHAFDQTTGSTTDLSFPNSGIIDGSLVGSDVRGSNLPGQGWAVNLPSQGVNGAIGVHLANITDTFQLDVALSALEDEGKARVLSAPKITTQSNIAASIISGASIPIQTVANNTIQVQYIDANLQLRVTPQVTAENTIILKLTVQNNRPDLATTVGLTGLPPINTRSANTTVLVPDGGTAVIGGVFILDEATAQSRIPFASRLPLLGWLFKNNTTRRNNNELLIFVTPRIKRTTGIASSAVPLTLSPSAR